MHRSKAYFQDKRIWLTGASSGIGRACAAHFVSLGAKVALSARNAQALESLVAELGQDNTLSVPLDVTDARANQHAVETLTAHWGGLDMVFLNAGNARYVDVQNFSSEIFVDMMQINYLSLVYGIEAALPALRQSTQPHLVGMSSVAAYAGLPRGEAYGASKAATRNMLQGLGIHLRHENIPVSIVCPGFVRTPLTDKNDFPMPMRIEAEDAAKIIAKELAQGREEIHFPKRFSYLMKCLASLPSPWYRRLLHRMTMPQQHSASLKKEF